MSANPFTRDKAIRSVAAYLGTHEWKCVTDTESNDVGQLIDPITGRTHDLDYAFTVQLHREQNGMQIRPQPQPSAE